MITLIMFRPELTRKLLSWQARMKLRERRQKYKKPIEKLNM